MDKVEKLLEKTARNKGEVKKWMVVVGIIVGLIFASGLFAFGLSIADLENYISNKPISQLYDFYDLKVGENETAIYFIGNSQIGADVYVPLIKDVLVKKGYSNLTLYNIYRDSDKPIRRLSQIEDLIASKPSLIIYGVSPWIFTNDRGWVDEDVILVHERLNINESAKQFYVDEELEDISRELDLTFIKRFVRGALIERLTGSSEKIDAITYTTEKIWDPWTSEEKRTTYSNTFGVNGEKLSEFVEITETHVNTSRNKMTLLPFTAEKTRNLLAFEYMLQRFSEEDIPVVLVIMPEHSILNDLTPDISETNLRKYLEETNLHWYDLDDVYGDEIMADLTHVHWDGAVELAPMWADIIIQEVESGAIHYS